MLLHEYSHVNVTKDVIIFKNQFVHLSLSEKSFELGLEWLAYVSLAVWSFL